MQSFRPLHPFQQESWLEPIQLRGAAKLQEGLLSLRFELDDPSGSLLLPARSPAPERRDGLWQTTCFEAFIAKDGEPGYWEINLAPSGDWNVYRLDDYRRGLRPEPSIQELGHRIQGHQAGFAIDLAIKLDSLMVVDSELELSLTAVLEQRGHGCSFWAWSHQAEEPDFHQRSSFQPIPKRK